MRADLQSSRTTEQELRTQLGIMIASERAMKLDLNQTKQDNESLQNRLHNLVQRNQQVSVFLRREILASPHYSFVRDE